MVSDEFFYREFFNLDSFLKHAEVIRQWAGLRPHRSSGVRMETEMFSDRKMVSFSYIRVTCFVAELRQGFWKLRYQIVLGNSCTI